MPLLTESEFDSILDAAGVAGKSASDILRERLAGFYERKIAAGELVAVKSSTFETHRCYEGGDLPYRCNECGCGFNYRAGFFYEKEDTPPKCCPGCAASFR